MLRETSNLEALLINLLLGTIWHFATFFICISVNPKLFDPNRKWYRPHKWEREGKFYNDYLKINKWKDFLPQHVGKDGFSKDHIDDLSIEYLDEFIMETCRGEWNHMMNCAFAIVLFIINGFGMALILSICVLLGNLPFAIIQRYNRFRLQKVKRTILKKQERKQRHLAQTVPKADPPTEPPSTQTVQEG